MGWWPLSKSIVRQGWAGLLACVQALLLRIQQLEAEIQRLRQQVQELQGRLAQNSQNSHRPPSADGLRKAAPKSLRSRGRRKPGGQPGHSGRTLERVAHPDRVEVHPLEICPQCRGRGLSQEPTVDYEPRQVFELPPRLLRVTEHRAEIKVCPHCGEVVRADFPAGVNAPAQYGPGFEGLMVYLNQQQLLPYERLSQLSEDLFGQPLSPGTVVNATARMYEQLEPFEKALVGQVSQAEVVQADESGLRVAAKLHWLHVASTPALTFYGVHAKRGTEAMDAFGILGHCRHWLIHDHWKPYFVYKQCAHGLCNQHPLRELKFLWEEQGQEWAQRLSQQLLRWQRTRQRRGPFNERAFKQALQRYHAILGQGRRQHPRREPDQARHAQSPAANLLDRLENFDLCHLAFLLDERVPFTNNQAEQDIRMIKVQQKISGCFRTLRGAQIFCRIRSYLSTCRKQGRNVWQAVQEAVLGQPFIPSAPPAGP